MLWQIAAVFCSSEQWTIVSVFPSLQIHETSNKNLTVNSKAIIVDLRLIPVKFLYLNILKNATCEKYNNDVGEEKGKIGKF
jgi:hypothetical protein